MTATTITYVHCDGCGDTNPDLGDSGDTATEQRQAFRLEGWRTGLPGGKDYCRWCWAWVRSSHQGRISHQV